MVALPGVFDPTAVPESDRNFEPIPQGNYKLQVIDSELLETSSGTGEYIKLTLEVVEGEYAGRRIWDNLNVRNENAQAQQIAQRALADLCLILGIGALKDTEELHFKPFTARVTIRKDKTGNYADQNGVRYTSGQGQPPAGKAKPEVTKPTATKPTQQPTANKSKPWASGGANKAPF